MWKREMEEIWTSLIEKNTNKKTNKMTNKIIINLICRRWWTKILWEKY